MSRTEANPNARPAAPMQPEKSAFRAAAEVAGDVVIFSEAARDALNQAVEIDRVLGQRRSALAALKATAADAAEALPAALAADAIDQAKSGEAGGGSYAALRSTADDLVSKVEMEEATIRALEGRRRQWDEEVKLAAARFHKALDGYKSATRSAFSVAIADALTTGSQPLVDLLAQGHALNSALNQKSFLGPLLEGILIPSALASLPAMVRGRRVTLQDDDYIDLAVDWSDYPGAGEVFEAARGLGALELQIRAYREFTPPQLPAEPYVRRGVEVAAGHAPPSRTGRWSTSHSSPANASRPEASAEAAAPPRARLESYVVRTPGTPAPAAAK